MVLAYQEDDGRDWPLCEWKTRETSRENDGPRRGQGARLEAKDFVMGGMEPAPQATANPHIRGTF